MNLFNNLFFKIKLLDIAPPVHTTPDTNEINGLQIGSILTIGVIGILVLWGVYRALKQSKQAENAEGTAQPQEKKSRHGFFKFIIAVLIICICLLGVVKAVDCAENPDNNDGITKPLSRSARLSDIKLENNVEATIMNLKDSYFLVPYHDIDDLQITFTYADDSGNILSRVTKDVGTVIKNSSYTITVEHTLSEMLAIRKYTYSVTGGTVSYFA